MAPTTTHKARMSWTVRVALAAALAMVAFAPGLALDPATDLFHYQRDLWRTRQGLPQNDVYAVLQTRDGYLWCGTEEGLARFDGVAFTVFDKRNTPALRSNNVSSLFEDRAGRLWVGTKGGGLARYEGGAFTSYTTDDGLSSDQVWAVLEDRAGRLWVGTAAGLDRLENGRFAAITARDGLSSDNIRALCEDRRGRLWVGTSGGGVNRIENDGKITAITTREGLANDFVQTIRETRDGSVWVGTAGGGLDRITDAGIVPVSTKQGLSSDFVWCVYEDSAGSVWVGTNDGGLDRIRGDRIETFGEKDGLSNNSVLSLCEDREGSLWVGAGSGGGLNRLKDGKVTVLTTRDGLPHANVRSVLAARDGALWAGTENGLARFADGEATVLGVKDGLVGSNVTSLLEARDGALWVGTYGKGVSRIGPDGRVASYTTANGLGNGLVRLMYEDRDGAIWLGTNRGVTVFRDGKFSTITSDDGLSSDVVTSIYQDRAGAMWIGTYGGGLDRLENGVARALTTRDGLTSDNIRFTFEDETGALWIGTEGGGLDRLSPDGRVVAVTTANGLHDDTAFDALDDGRGSLWLNCNKGVYRVATRELRDFADGRTASVSCVAYGTADGMLSAECNSGQKPGSTALADGRLAFATNDGVAIVDPAHARANEVVPPVVVERVLVDRKPLASGAAAPGAESFEFHYTALSLRVPERVRFRYMLEGFDREWVDAGTRRTAYYTNIPHGSYTFRVVACNDDGLWNEEGASYALTIEPFFYQTWLFYLAVASAVALAAFALYRGRVRALKTRERELVALVDERTRRLREEKELTEAERAEAQRQSARAEEANRAKSTFLATMSHELRTPLSAVLGFAQLMERDAGLAPEHRESVGTIMRSGEHLLGLINDVLSLSKIEAGRQELVERVFDLGELLDLVVAMTRVRSEAKGLDLRVDLAPDLPRYARADESKLRQILLNLLGNAVKFTERGSVTLRARREGAPREGASRAVFEVEDTGRGIAPEEAHLVFTPFVQTQSGVESSEGTGLGLALSRSFARLMGGDLGVTSEPGRGTTFRLEVPLPEADASEAREGGRRRTVSALAPGEPAYRVLVVDDVPETRSLLARLLAAAGFEAREAEGGREAVAAWSEWRPEAILMDVRMPEVDGLEATRRIRRAEAESGGRVPIVAVSASVMGHEIEDVLAAGCDDFLPKPFREAALFEKLGALLGATFVREDVPSPAGASPVAAPAGSLGAVDPALVERLRRSVAAGDVEEARRVAAEVRAADETLGRRLDDMIRRYRFDELDALLSLPGGPLARGDHERRAADDQDRRERHRAEVGDALEVHDRDDGGRDEKHDGQDP